MILSIPLEAAQPRASKLHLSIPQTQSTYSGQVPASPSVLSTGHSEMSYSSSKLVPHSRS